MNDQEMRRAWYPGQQIVLRVTVGTRPPGTRGYVIMVHAWGDALSVQLDGRAFWDIVGTEEVAPAESDADSAAPDRL